MNFDKTGYQLNLFP